MAHDDQAATLFPEDTQTWTALPVAAMATGDDGMAVTALGRLLTLSPGFNEFWRRAFDFCRGSTDAGFADMVARARAFFRGQRQLHNVLSCAPGDRERWDDAEAEARACPAGRRGELTSALSDVPGVDWRSIPVFEPSG